MKARENGSEVYVCFLITAHEASSSYMILVHIVHPPCTTSFGIGKKLDRPA